MENRTKSLIKIIKMIKNCNNSNHIKTIKNYIIQSYKLKYINEKEKDLLLELLLISYGINTNENVENINKYIYNENNKYLINEYDYDQYF